MQIQTSKLYQITYLYLTIPFIIFCMGWLRLFIALPISLLLLWALWVLWKNTNAQAETTFIKITIAAILLTGLWVLFSGVGGYAFQNWDHHWRNAVFHDLIKYDWPVIYSAPEKGPIKMLVYYVGYWLPSALVGKVFGWQAANAFLFLWTWFGAILVGLHLSLKLKASVFKSVLLLIAFSGMDALGVLFFSHNAYPTLWPPIQHLEIWAGDLQYSAFTTQLFWVFNQAVPTWLCAVLLLNGLKRDQAAFVWALCFFLAPLASIGLLPFVLIEWFKQTKIKSPFQGLRVDLLLASGMIVIISYLFFSSNTAAQERGFQALAIKDVIVFFLIEGGLIWLLLAPRLWRDPRWMITGVILFFAPFIQFGSGRDFVMRASIVPLFFLMVWCGEIIFKEQSTRVLRITLLALLAIGALTPLYEINRSVYRTFQYYFVLDESQRAKPTNEPVTHLEQNIAPEAEHPGALTADAIKTFAFMDDQLSKNFIANVRQSLYYRYISPR